MVLLIGLAVGVDYSMFYLKRERQERAAGRSRRAAHRSRRRDLGPLGAHLRPDGDDGDGRACSSTGDRTFASLALATILVVAVAVLGSLTVLPALLSRLGDNVDRLRDPARPAAPPRRRRGPVLGHDRRSRPAPARALRGRRRAVLLALAAPALQPAARGSGARVVPAVTRRHEDVQPDAAGVPGHGAARERRRQGTERARACRRRGGRAAPQAGACERPDVRADHRRRQHGGHGREHRRSDRGERNRRRVGRCAPRSCATRSFRRRSAPFRTRKPA